jgi:hypothetical protein
MKLFAFIFFSLASLACAATQDFDMLNLSGYDVNNVYLAPLGARDWGTDVLPYDEELHYRDNVRITFNDANPVRYYYLKVVFVGGVEYHWDDPCDLFKVYKMTLLQKPNGQIYVHYDYIP